MNAIAQTAADNLTQHQTVSAGWKLWTGRILSVLLGAFFLFDAVMKLVKPAQVVAATLQLGFRESSIVPIGIALLVCTVFYFVPRTAIFGALLFGISLRFSILLSAIDECSNGPVSLPKHPPNKWLVGLPTQDVARLPKMREFRATHKGERAKERISDHVQWPSRRRAFFFFACHL